jgi:hypothetical protein
MKHLRIFLRAAILLGAFAVSVSAQGASATSPAGEMNADAKATSSYNKAKNETTYEIKLLQIPAAAQQVALSVSFTFAGEKFRKQPDDVIFILSVVSPGAARRYSDMIAMKVTADGKKLPEVLMLNLDKRALGESNYLETIGTRMKYDVFKKLSEAKSAALQLENTKLELSEAHLKKLAELEAMMRPN